jgi:hypothetical protein
MPSQIFPYTDQITFITQKGQLKLSAFIIINPLEPNVWAALLALLIGNSLAMYFIANVEESFAMCNYSQWSHLTNIFWFSIGSMVGQGFTRFKDTSSAWALR